MPPARHAEQVWQPASEAFTHDVLLPVPPVPPVLPPVPPVPPVPPELHVDGRSQELPTPRATASELVEAVQRIAQLCPIAYTTSASGTE